MNVNIILKLISKYIYFKKNYKNNNNGCLIMVSSIYTNIPH